MQEDLNVAENRVARTRGQKQELESEAQLLGQKAVSTKEAYALAITNEEEAREELKQLLVLEKDKLVEAEKVQTEFDTVVESDEEYEKIL